MFQPEYLQKLIEIGERDAEAQMSEIGRILSSRAPAARETAGELDVVS